MSNIQRPMSNEDQLDIRNSYMGNKSRYSTLFCLLLTLIGFGQKKYSVNIEHYTVKEGLSHHETYAITQDHRGIIWIGTKYGLNRFDGQSFKSFTIEDGLQHNAINQLFLDQSRYLWLLHNKTFKRDYLYQIGEVEIFDTYHLKAIPLAEYWQTFQLFNWKEIQSCQIMGERLLFTLKTGEQYIYKSLQSVEKLPLQHPNEQILHYSDDKKHWTLQATSEGYWLKRKDQNGQLLGQVAIAPLRELKLHWLNEDEKGNHYFAKFHARPDNIDHLEIIKINSTYEEARHLLIPEAAALGIYATDILYHPGIKAYWMANNAAAFLRNAVDKDLFQLIDDTRFFGSLNRQNFTSDNTIWQCGNDGFYKFTFKINHFQNVLTNVNSQGFRGITRVGERIFFSSRNGIYRKEPNGQIPEKFTLPVFGLSVLADTADQLWSANFNNLLRCDVRPKKVNTYRQDREELQNIGYCVQAGITQYDIPVHEPWSLFKDQQGGIWFGAYGFYRFDPNSERLDTARYNQFTELAEHIIYDFHEVENDTLLLSTTAGIYKFHPKLGVLERYWSGGKGKYYLPADDFRHLYYDETKGVFWLATGQKGIICWSPQEQKTQVFSFHKRITNTIHGIYEDEFGHLWMPTDNGIVQFDKQSHVFKIYTTNDGLYINEFNRISHFQDEDGTMYFGNVNGVTIFHPRDFKDNLHEQAKTQPIVVEVQQYLGETNQVEIRTAHFLQHQQIILSPNDRYFNLTLGLNDYISSDEALYYYQLKDVDTSWTLTEGNQITLGRLPFGKHSLSVKVLLPDGQFSPSHLAIPIQVLKPFYLKLWFILLCIALIALIFYGIYRYQIVQYQKRQEIRTRIATDLHDDVGSLLHRLNIQVEMMKYVSEERKQEIIQEMANTSRVSLDMMRDIIWAIDARNDKSENILLRMEEQMAELLQPLDIPFELDTSQINHQKPLSSEVRQNIFLIFKEAITNIGKHSKAKKVLVQVVYTKKLFQFDVQEIHPSTSHNEGTPKSKKSGTGLKNMQLRAERIKADLSIDKEKGYRVVLRKRL